MRASVITLALAGLAGTAAAQLLVNGINIVYGNGFNGCSNPTSSNARVNRLVMAESYEPRERGSQS